MRLTPLAAAFAIIGVSACQPIQDRATTSDFRRPDSAGLIRADLDGDSSRIARRVRLSDGSGFAYSVGRRSGEGFAGYAGLLPATSLDAAPARGGSTIDANYHVAEITDIDLNGRLLSGRTGTASGPITLRASFDDGTLRGTSDDGRLVVSGDISGRNTLDGEVRWRGLEGDLSGQVSAAEVVGAFHGNDAKAIFAGGITHRE